MTAHIGNTKLNFSFTFTAVITLTMLLADADTALISLASAAAHEAGHLLAMRLFGDSPQQIDFGAFGIRITRNGSTRVSLTQEAIIAFAGVAVNFIVAALSAAGYHFLKFAFFKQSLAVNLILAFFNLLPFEVLDGGRALRFLLEARLQNEKTEVILKITSYITVAFLCAVGVYLYLYSGFSVGLIAVTVYLAVIIICAAVRQAS